MSESHGRSAPGLEMQGLRMHALRTHTLLLIVAALLAGAAHAEPRTKADAVLVYKSERLLMLLRAGEVIGHFPISLGKNPVGPKTHEGDARTPEGRYYLDWRNPDSRFYRSIHISYPSPRDLAHAHRAGASPGGMVMIHGLAERSGPGADRLGRLDRRLHRRRQRRDGRHLERRRRRHRHRHPAVI